MAKRKKGGRKSPAAPTFMTNFYTRTRANEGIRVSLFDPATNKETEHWIQVLGVDSDAFREADATENRRLMDVFQMKDPKEQAREMNASRMRLMASLVAAWSFPEPCNEKNVVTFLTEAPQIASKIDFMSARRALFFAKSSTTSSDSPSTSSSSTSDPKTPS